MSSATFTPHHRDLIFSALLASFWRKQALRKFLRGTGISENALSTWNDDETKREFLDRIFPKIAESPKGPVALRAMSRALCEQASFPDLEGWEDSSVKKDAALRAVNALRAYEKNLSEQQAAIQERAHAQARYRSHQEMVRQRETSLAKLKSSLEADLYTKIGTPQAGYDFQSWFYELADFFEIQNRRPYNTNGRQIDGSLTLDGTTYLVELKFTTGQTEAPEIDVFFKKVSEKADNTMGIFLSMSGYTRGAMASAAVPRTPLLLLDHSHVYAVLTQTITLPDLIARVRRHVSQTGEPHLPVTKFSG